MLLSDAIKQLQAFAAQLPADAKFELYDRTEDRAVVVEQDAEDEIWDFEILRGENEVVIEFD